MHPSMVITAPESGMIYINGHFAGETGEKQPLMRAVNPTGAIYIEYRPLTGRFLPLARRIVFSGGMPLAESADAAEDLLIVCWPGKIIEIELLPEETRPAAPILFEAGNRGFVMDSGRLMRGKHVLAQLPQDAEIPVLKQAEHGNLLIGRHTNGMYLVSFSPEMDSANGFLLAKQIEVENDGRIRAMVDRGDLVGHASLESWKLEEGGLRMISSEPVWAKGSPCWPQTALQTVCAAIEAEMAGLHAEAEGYLSPALKSGNILHEIAESFDFCTEMKYPLTDGRPCAALIRLEGGVMAKVRPLFYRASASGGMQGGYQIDAMEIG